MAARTPAQGDGYWLLDFNGFTVPFGGAPTLGSANLPAGEFAIAVIPTSDGEGGWVLSTSGRVVPLGTAKFYGDVSDRRLNKSDRRNGGDEEQ
jgi:hypothetical protein